MSVPETFDTPEAVEQAFYEAFARADLDAMTQVWSRSGNAECVHPMSDRLRGHEAILRSWSEIFGQAPGMRFALTHAHRVRHGDMAVHIVYENLAVEDRAEPSRVIATNVFAREDGGWKMILHHASPASRPTRAPTEQPRQVH